MELARLRPSTSSRPSSFSSLQHLKLQTGDSLTSIEQPILYGKDGLELCTTPFAECLKNFLSSVILFKAGKLENWSSEVTYLDALPW